MILYSLACEDGHRFQSWFRDSATYEYQASRHLVSCPTCRSTRVAKTIMSPAVAGSRKTEVYDAVEGPSEKASNATMAMDVALLDPRHQELAARLKTLRKKIVAEGDDVGTRFPQEARRIHDGEAPARQIYGQASVTEARELLEDGILILPLPALPDDLN